MIREYEIGDKLINNKGFEVEIIDIIKRDNSKNIIEVYNSEIDEFQVGYESDFSN